MHDRLPEGDCVWDYVTILIFDKYVLISWKRSKKYIHSYNGILIGNRMYRMATVPMTFSCLIRLLPKQLSARTTQQSILRIKLTYRQQIVLATGTVLDCQNLQTCLVVRSAHLLNWPPTTVVKISSTVTAGDRLFLYVIHQLQ